jgi:hypothetical protein
MDAERMHIRLQNCLLFPASSVSCLRSRTMARSALTSKPLPLASAYTSRMSSAIAFFFVFQALDRFDEGLHPRSASRT